MTKAYLGPPSPKLLEWAKRHVPTESVTLTLHVEYDAATYGTTTGRIEDADGTTLPTDIPISITKGSSIALKARPVAEAVEQFVKWMDDPELEADRIVAMDSSKELTALFHQNVS